MFSRLKNLCLVTLLPFVMASSVFAASQDDELLVDPTLPLSMAFNAGNAANIGDSDNSLLDLLSGAFTGYELSSILVRAEDRIAVINGERVRVGDKIGSAVVASIEADRVTLNVGGDIETLELYENSIKTPVKGDE